MNATSVLAEQAAPLKRKKRAIALEPVVDISLAMNTDLSKRPMIGHDIDRFRGRHSLHTVDVIYALCIQNSAAYNKLVRKASIPFATELLIRLYDQYPGYAPWKEVKPDEAFQMLYGDVMRQFEGSELEKEARLALYRRAMACFGRSVYTAYRWFDSEGNANSKRAVLKIFAKLSELDNPRETLEAIARQMLKVRGIMLDAAYPLPTLENPPIPKRRGPAPKPRKTVVGKAKVAAVEPKAAKPVKPVKPAKPVKAAKSATPEQLLAKATKAAHPKKKK